ncbi:hypothetical protein SAICODRAFT_174571 [Saitoella complicata NRRL Y-17804]|uniref:uncharacterized protein n=1 Tax=Saitoella complicata (strain BCRC 22490 / CBS 7301 / JCM 7358 / NBRC 10748 / NRRL Y-17804) TaxID=698492 RepID=UPI0008670B57|nr:uncharacterized protein SAICODRAFT_174571 [Saitoella complicata NRRL Y-17804]ODQ50259.1 hypothetical protein SAICODRAFT_174571 [Saitoella complicata NRRL Y-17804]
MDKISLVDSADVTMEGHANTGPEVRADAAAVSIGEELTAVLDGLKLDLKGADSKDPDQTDAFIADADLLDSHMSLRSEIAATARLRRRSYQATRASKSYTMTPSPSPEREGEGGDNEEEWETDASDSPRKKAGNRPLPLEQPPPYAANGSVSVPTSQSSSPTGRREQLVYHRHHRTRSNERWIELLERTNTELLDQVATLSDDYSTYTRESKSRLRRAHNDIRTLKVELDEWETKDHRALQKELEDAYDRLSHLEEELLNVEQEKKRNKARLQKALDDVAKLKQKYDDFDKLKEENEALVTRVEDQEHDLEILAAALETFTKHQSVGGAVRKWRLQISASSAEQDDVSVTELAESVLPGADAGTEATEMRPLGKSGEGRPSGLADRPRMRRADSLHEELERAAAFSKNDGLPDRSVTVSSVSTLVQSSNTSPPTTVDLEPDTPANIVLKSVKKDYLWIWRPIFTMFLWVRFVMLLTIALGMALRAGPERVLRIAQPRASQSEETSVPDQAEGRMLGWSEPSCEEVPEPVAGHSEKTGSDLLADPDDDLSGSWVYDEE